MRSSIKKETENIKQNQTEILKLKNKMTELKSSTKSFNSIFEQIEGRISGQEDKSTEIVQLEKQEEKRMQRNKESLQKLWDIIKRNNVHITGVPEGGEKEKGVEAYLKK